MTLWVSSSPVLILKRSILEMRGKLNDFVCNSFICVARTCPPPIHELFEGFLIEFRQGFLRKSLVKGIIKDIDYKQSCWLLSFILVSRIDCFKISTGLELTQSVINFPIFPLRWRHLGQEVFNGVAGMIKRCKNTSFEIANFINDNSDHKKSYWWR